MREKVAAGGSLPEVDNSIETAASSTFFRQCGNSPAKTSLV